VKYYDTVVCFAGDALICVFRSILGPKTLIPQSLSDDSVEDTNKNYCLRALQCATELKKRENEHLACHIAVTYGEINLAILGGHNDEWSYIINGPCLSELSSCIDDAGPKEVVCSRTCYDKATGVTELQAVENNLNDNKRRTDLVNGLLCCSGSGNYLITSVTASKYHKGRKRTTKTGYQAASTSSSSSSSSAASSMYESMSYANKDRSSDRLSSDCDFDGELQRAKFKIRKLESDRDRDREIGKDKCKEKEKDIEKDIEKDKMKNRNIDENKHSDSDRDKVKESKKEKEKEREKEKEKGKGKEKEKEKEKKKEKESERRFRRNDMSPDNNQSKDTLDVSEHCPKVEFSSRVLEAAEYFVPRPALSAIYSSSLDSISELRQVTTMFLRLDTYSHVLHQDPVSLQPFFLLLQQVLDESGGFLRQFLVDDKVRHLDAS
jgi:hypothetical protein